MTRKGHIPTFKPSSASKVRIKPAGRIAVLVALVILAGGAAWGGRALSSWGRLRPLRMAADTPSQEPSPHGDNATPRAVEAPVWWASQMQPVRDPVTGHASWMAPKQVVQAVVADQQREAELLEIADLAQYRRALPHYYSGQMLAQQLDRAETTVRFRMWDEGVAFSREVKDFAADGLACTVGLRQRGGTVYLQDRASGQVHASRSDVLTLLRMRYDAREKRWKAERTLAVVPLDPAE